MASAATHLAPVSPRAGRQGCQPGLRRRRPRQRRDWAVEAIFRNSGQLPRRVAAVRAVRRLDEFMDRFVEAAEAPDHRRPVRPGHEFSALASRKHFDKVRGYVESVEVQGGKILTGGVDEDGSWLVRPTIITGLPLTAPQYCEEIFGPVCVVNKFETEDEVLAWPTTPATGSTRCSSPRTSPVRTGSPRAAGRHGLGQLLLHPRPAHAVRRRRRLGRGPRGGHFSREFFTEPKAVVMQIDRG